MHDDSIAPQPWKGIRAYAARYFLALIVLFISAIGVIELVSEGGEGGALRGGLAVNAFCFFISIAALLFCKRYPLEVLVFELVVAYTTIYALYFDAQPPLTTFFAILTAIFAAAFYGEGRRGDRVGLVFGAAVLLLDVPRLINGFEIGNVVLTWVWLVVVWMLGRTFGRRSRENSLLVEHTTLLEAERDRKIAEATLDERARIARELHDVVAHSVSVMVIQSAAERRDLAGEGGRTYETLSSIESTGRDTLVELRRMLGVLRSVDASTNGNGTSPQPSLGMLDELVTTARESGTDVTLKIDGTAITLPAGVDLSAYRIVQEALTNVRKHAPTAATTVTVTYSAAEVALEVIDDGPLTTIAQNGGHGLIGMRERVALHDGSFAAAPRESGGFRVFARLPVEPGS
jgi:signal transduction histidine kinase